MAKGYSGKNVTAAIKSVYEGANEEEEAETFDTITNDYWDTQAENTADYDDVQCLYEWQGNGL